MCRYESWIVKRYLGGERFFDELLHVLVVGVGLDENESSVCGSLNHG